MDEEHKLLRDIRKRGPGLPEGRRDILYRTAANNSAIFSPEARAGFIQRVNSELMADDGSSPRQRAQLLALRNHLTEKDAELRRDKR